MSKQPKEQTIESLKVQAVKIHYRYMLALGIIVSLVVGVIFGYFMTINTVTNIQSKVVNSIQLVSKDQK